MERITSFGERKERPGSARLVVVGLGAFTPLGPNVDEMWTNYLAGEKRAKLLFDERFDSRVALPIDKYNPLDYFPKRQLSRLGIATQYSGIASKEALVDAGIISEDGSAKTEIDEMRFGVHIGTGIGGVEDYGEAIRVLDLKGPSRIDPFSVLRILPERVATVPSMMFGFRGWSGTTVAACATGEVNIANAAILIKANRADVMLCGGAEGTLTEVVQAGFGNMRALAMGFNDNPESASRPFNVDRSGFVPSEGAAVMILEELEHAKARGAKIYAELAGMHCSLDANHDTQPHNEVIAKTIDIALYDAKIRTPDLIVAHGTSTKQNEENEVDAWRMVFKEDLPNIRITAPKSVFGHSLGAAGAINAIVAVKAIHEQIIPGTVNLDNIDPKFRDLDIPRKSVRYPVKTVVADSFGFGGINAVLVFKEYEKAS